MDVSGNVNPVATVPADSFGAIKSMRLAKLSPGNINYANAHATSTLVAHGPKNKLLRLSLMDVRGRIIVSLVKML
ncbi:hypothetical protein BDC45DRAFT_571037 [Circinella umbellata]|nr:hypothetical protein BDC45DRAFT_571037 [Circinella umbellata]